MHTIVDLEPAVSFAAGPLKRDPRSITIVAETLGPGRGGAELYLGHLATYLAEAGHAIQIYVRSRPASVSENVQLEVIPTMRRFRVLWERVFARRIARRLSVTRPDIVLSTLPLPGITHYQPHSGLYPAAFAATHRSLDRGLTRRIDSFGHTLNLRRRSLIEMQDRLLSSSDPPQVMTFSHAVRAQFVSAYPSLSANVVTVPQGVDLERFYPGIEGGSEFRKRVPGRLSILFVAQNFRLKGLSCLLEAFGEAIRQGLRADLLVVGSRRGANRSFPALAQRHRLGANVHFLGTVSDSDMPSLYRSCDALVHPTFSDHCSLVVLEALACGLPVITTRQNGAAELIENGREGRILESPEDVGALARALLQLGDTRQLRLMRAAAVAVRPQIDFQLHARLVAAWLVMGGHPPGRKAHPL